MHQSKTRAKAATIIPDDAPITPLPALEELDLCSLLVDVVFSDVAVLDVEFAVFVISSEPEL